MLWVVGCQYLLKPPFLVKFRNIFNNNTYWLFKTKHALTYNETQLAYLSDHDLECGWMGFANYTPIFNPICNIYPTCITICKSHQNTLSTRWWSQRNEIINIFSHKDILCWVRSRKMINPTPRNGMSRCVGFIYMFKMKWRFFEKFLRTLKTVKTVSIRINTEKKKAIQCQSMS